MDAAATQHALPAGLDVFIAAAVDAFGPDLRSVVLFGSAAEGRLRPTSDVNLMLVLRAFDPARADRLREPLRLAAAGLRLAPMFVLDGELAAAEAAFANKFMDIAARRRVLWGDDPFAQMTIPRDVALARLRQVLLNLLMRLRARYATDGGDPGRLALIVADVAGPLRAAAATLVSLEGQRVASPREALERVAPALLDDGAGPLLRALSQARETGALPPEAARETTLTLLNLVGRLHARAAALT